MSTTDQTNPTVSATDVSSAKKPSRRVKFTQYVGDKLFSEFKFIEQHKILNDQIEKNIEQLRELRAQMRNLESSYYVDIVRAMRQRRKRANTNPGGFNKKRAFPDKLLDIVSVPHGTEFTMPEYAKLFKQELTKRDLTYKGDATHKADGRVYRADKQILEAFNMPASVNKSVSYKDKAGFNINTFQTYLSAALKGVAPVLTPAAAPAMPVAPATAVVAPASDVASTASKPRARKVATSSS